MDMNNEMEVIHALIAHITFAEVSEGLANEGKSMADFIAECELDMELDPEDGSYFLSVLYKHSEFARFMRDLHDQL